MKKLYLAIGLLAITTSAYPENQGATQDQDRLQMAKVGCQKPLGFFPTPSKIMCMLTALGISEQTTKPKAFALMFNVCQGRTLQPLPSNYVPKKYPTLNACLSDPSAIGLINKELQSQGFPAVKVVNPGVLSSPT
ncbi:MAG: hypothetical protein H0U71_03345 [Gammaproteobacteria bacterium]|nr:hypothetical protein [Gammaproteobacteria bacterium]